MSLDECIIFLQAMKPIKANKYWYYKMHPRRDEAKNAEENHKSIKEPRRGEFKITNPYELNSTNDLADLFGAPQMEEDIVVDELNVSKPEVKTSSSKLEEYDLQAELEKKFDELFGNQNKK